jgi:hypothetical protein
MGSVAKSKSRPSSFWAPCPCEIAARRPGGSQLGGRFADDDVAGPIHVGLQPQSLAEATRNRDPSARKGEDLRDVIEVLKHVLRLQIAVSLGGARLPGSRRSRAAGVVAVAAVSGRRLAGGSGLLRAGWDGSRGLRSGVCRLPSAITTSRRAVQIMFIILLACTFTCSRFFLFFT